MHCTVWLTVFSYLLTKEPSTLRSKAILLIPTDDITEVGAQAEVEVGIESYILTDLMCAFLPIFPSATFKTNFMEAQGR